MDTKTKRRTPPGEPAYHRLTDEKRIIIETLRKEGRSLSYIAERIGCNKSTVRSSAWAGARLARRSRRPCTATSLPRPDAASLFEMACPGGRAWPSAHIRREGEIFG